MTQIVEVSAELVERLKQEDKDEAWREFYLGSYDKIYRFFRSRVSTHQQAEDLASDVWLEAFRCIDSFRWQGVPFGAWLFGIARRVLASHYRARPQQPVTSFPDEHHCEDLDYLRVEIRDILERIKPEYCEALELRYIIGLSGEEAAAVIGKTHGAFRALLLRACRAYRAESEG